MKYLLFVTSLFFSMAAFPQIISGLYSGELVNDSTKKTQRYELALSEYRGKITGYSYTTFVSNDTFYYSIKRVKGKKEKDQLIVQDDKMIANNFPEAAAKGVHQINYINLTGEDTLRTVKGRWETTRTKKYYSIGGAAAMRLDNDSTHSALIGHLKELNIIRRPNYQSAITKVKATEEKAKIKTQIKNPETEIFKTEVVRVPYTKRKNNTIETINIISDSLFFSLYDNGVIDGDSVSVYINGQPILLNSRLTATATKKAIKLPPVDSIEILLVAENLGTLPPNTGLVVIKEGDKTYQINFSADMKTNASILLKRKIK